MGESVLSDAVDTDSPKPTEQEEDSEDAKPKPEVIESETKKPEVIEPEEDKEPKKPIPISQKIDKFAQKIKEVQEREEREEKEREEKGVLYDVIYSTHITSSFIMSHTSFDSYESS